MKAYVLFDGDGRIHQSHASTVEITPDSVPDGLQLAEGYGSCLHDYVSGGKVVQRPSMEIELNGNTLSGVTAGATISIEGTEYTADGTDIDLSFDIPGKYMVEISMWPFITWRESVDYQS
jgi:hypothetical protein